MTDMRHQKAAAKEFSVTLGIPYATALRLIKNVQDYDPGLRGAALQVQVELLLAKEPVADGN
jgi:hypothetical protein